MLLNMQVSQRNSKKHFSNQWHKLNSSDTYRQKGKSSTTCKCPKCGDNHKVRIQWTGRGTPRIYCSDCKQLIAAIDSLCSQGATGSIARRTNRNSGHAVE